MESFNALNNSLSALRLSEELCEKIYRHLAAILYLGNVYFENTDEGHAEISGDASIQCIEYAASLLEIDSKQLQNVVLTRKYTTPANRAFLDEDILYAL